MKIAIQGEAASFHEVAAQQFFGRDDATIVPCNTFTDVFKALKNDTVDAAVVAIENSLYGSIREVVDLCLAHHYPIVGEVVLHIHQQLIVFPDAQKSDIKRIFSHPVALDQCRDYLEKNFPDAELVEHHDTAGAVEFIKEHDLKNAAAIASAAAAKLHGMHILEHEIEDEKINFTRFVVIQKKSREIKDANKASLILSTSHQPGALYHALGVFAHYDANLTKLESRPIRGEHFKYQFFVSVEIDHATLDIAIEELKVQDCNVILLGHYQTA